MDTSAVLSDDDYDLISNPESSIADLTNGIGRQPVHEPPASSIARDSFDTVTWTASEIHASVRKALHGPATQTNGSTSTKNGISENNKVFRVYVDGIFDVFNVGNALHLRQAKLSFPHVYLIVGVFSDESLNQSGHNSTWTEAERIEIVRHCRWVDEVITEAPWEVSESFLQSRRIDYIAIEEGTSVDPACDKMRVRGYDEIKKLGKVLQTKRTGGLTVHRSIQLATPLTPTMMETPVPNFVVTDVQEDTSEQ